MKTKYLLYFFCINNIFALSPQFIDVNRKIIATKTINFITHKLPSVDTFGHKNLEFNDKVIPVILENNHISSELKSDLIVGLIQFSQFGDNFGSWLLEHYLNLIKYLVHYV